MKTQYLTIAILLVFSVVAAQIGVAGADSSIPYAGTFIASGDNVVTLSQSNIPVEKVFRGRFRYRPYAYYYGYYPYYYSYGYPNYSYYYYGYPNYRRYYRPYARYW